jgi:hypothetical protein
MLFNADRQTKDNIRNMYKQEAEIFSKKKLDDKSRKLQEEKEYMRTLEEKYEEESRRKHMEKIKKINDTMGEYNQVVRQKEQSKNFSKHREVNFNTYGMGVGNGENTGGVVNTYSDTKTNTNVNANEYGQRNYDYENTLRNQKTEQQRLYKDYLDSQVCLYN